jgi:hypothetical protein
MCFVVGRADWTPPKTMSDPEALLHNRRYMKLIKAAPPPYFIDVFNVLGQYTWDPGVHGILSRGSLAPPDFILCCASVVPGRKSGFRAESGPDSSRENI